MSDIRVRDIESAIAARFPVERAEGWDRVGMSAGDRDAVVTGVLLALDPTRAAITRAAELDANVVVTHHPPFIEPPAKIVPGPGAGGVLFEALSKGISLVNAHTNLDRDAEAQSLLANSLGLEPEGPLEVEMQPTSVVTVFAPSEASERIRAVMTAAGAGRIGTYEGCSFSAHGTGSFVPGAGAAPSTGIVGQRTDVEEERIEMVVPKRYAARVAAEAAAAHPYEEPLVFATDVVIGRNAARMGAVSAAPGQMRLRALAELIARTFGVTPKVYGDPEKRLGRVATTTGSGTSLIPAARAAAVDAIVLGEVRYHDALDASETGLAVVEIGHDVSEWPMMALLDKTVRGVAGIEESTVHLLPSRPAWWTS